MVTDRKTIPTEFHHGFCLATCGFKASSFLGTRHTTIEGKAKKGNAGDSLCYLSSRCVLYHGKNLIDEMHQAGDLEIQLECGGVVEEDCHILKELLSIIYQ